MAYDSYCPCGCGTPFACEQALAGYRAERIAHDEEPRDTTPEAPPTQRTGADAGKEGGNGP